MSNKQVLILDCNGQSKPAICFNLEVAGFEMRVVTDVDEVINLLANSRLTEENFSVLLVNNPYLNIDINQLLEDVKNIGIEIPVVFVKESKSLQQIVEELKNKHQNPLIFQVEPVGLVDLLITFRQQTAVLDTDKKAS